MSEFRRRLLMQNALKSIKPQYPYQIKYGYKLQNNGDLIKDDKYVTVIDCPISNSKAFEWGNYPEVYNGWYMNEYDKDKHLVDYWRNTSFHAYQTINGRSSTSFIGITFNKKIKGREVVKDTTNGKSEIIYDRSLLGKNGIEEINGYRLETNGTLVKDDNFFVIRYIPIQSSVKYIEYGIFLNTDYGISIEKDSNKKIIDFWGGSRGSRRKVDLSGGFNTKYMSASFLKDNFDDGICAMIDITNNIYLYKGNNL